MTDTLGVMNNTKWDELRLAMCSFNPAPQFRCMNLNGHYSTVDREWFYHFREGGYEDLLYVDIFPDSVAQQKQIIIALKNIHLPGEIAGQGFRVYGYISAGQVVDYL
jgi:hypothetical protein